MPEHRLVCIGDSLSQGFKSGAIFEPHLSYPATIAWEMGLGENDFRYASFSGNGGLPINIEYLLRRIDHEFGDDVNWWELPLVPIYLRQWMDTIEDYWERGTGAAPINYRGPYHNLAVWGFQVQDAYLLTAQLCRRIASQTSDDWLNQVPENAMYRTALRVLNPSQTPDGDDATQITRAQELAASGGVENLIVFLGANNVLGTVTALGEPLESTDAELTQPDPQQRPATIYSPRHFEAVLNELVKQVEQIGAERVFWGTVPPVTVPPVTNGVGGRMNADMGVESPYGQGDHPQWYRRYFRYYTRPWIPDGKFRPHEDPHLTGENAMKIDWTIAQYKRSLHSAIDAHNQKRRQANQRDDWFVVDIHWALERIAYRRYVEDPSVPPPPAWSPYEMPSSLRQLGLDTQFLRAKQGQRVAGGLFSLDGIHATTVAYGLVAQEFINVMQHAGVAFHWGDGVTPRVGPVTVDYERLLRLDTLAQSLPRTLDDLWDKLVDGNQVLDIFKRALRPFA